MAAPKRTIKKFKPDSVVEVRFPFPDSALPQLWDWLNAHRAMVADDDAPQTLDEFIDTELMRTHEGCRKFGVWRDDELGGCIWAEEINRSVQNAVQAHCVFKEDFFGHATTLPALYQMAELLFEGGYKKIEMPTFNHNSAIIGLLTRAGAHPEGLVRAHATQSGKPVDVKLFAFFDTDMEMIRSKK